MGTVSQMQCSATNPHSQQWLWHRNLCFVNLRKTALWFASRPRSLLITLYTTRFWWVLDILEPLEVQGVLTVLRSIRGWGAYWTDGSGGTMLYVFVYYCLMMWRCDGRSAWTFRPTPCEWFCLLCNFVVVSSGARVCWIPWLKLDRRTNSR